MRYVVGAVSVIVLAAGVAHATTFSFAADTDPFSSTWRGLQGAMRNAQDPGDPVTLTIDDDNGPGPALTFNVDFHASFAINRTASIPLGGGRFLHSYDISGVPEGAATFGFFLPSGAPLLTATFTGGNMSSLGTQNAWGTAGGVQATDIAGQVTYTWFGPDMPAYGLFNGQSSVGIDDAAFTLTALHNAGGPGVPLNDVGLPSLEWLAEGSYSGTAHFVPTPGAAALLGLGSLALIRRRR